MISKIITLLFFLPLHIAESIDEKIDKIFEPIANFLDAVIFFSFNFGDGLSVPFILIWLLVGAIFFTFFLKFTNITGFKHALDIVRGKFDNPDDKGEVSHFQALTAALSGTVGIGNIAGVAVAISIGGPGATFWMICAGLFGMTSKFAECTLGLKYRKIGKDGNVSGGPMYYLSEGLKKQNLGKLGKVLAVVFSVCCIGASFGGGNMVQINQATKQLIDITGGTESIFYNSGWVFGLIMSVMVGLVIIGGIKSIANITDKIVPFMIGVYGIGAFVVLAYHFDKIPWAIQEIFAGAFTQNAAFGGFVGVLILGFRRAAFSNEAGVGSASIAHSAAKTNEPVSEGMVALLEPFIDTVIVCSMTAIVIIITGFAPTETQEIAGGHAISLTSRAFESVMPFFPIVLALAVILFALSTMISWSYYGLKSWAYLFGESKYSKILYQTIFCSFIVFGSAISAEKVFGIGDAMIFAMAFPNFIGLYLLSGELRKDLKSYLKRVKSGEIKRYKK